LKKERKKKKGKEKGKKRKKKNGMNSPCRKKHVVAQIFYSLFPPSLSSSFKLFDDFYYYYFPIPLLLLLLVFLNISIGIIFFK